MNTAQHILYEVVNLINNKQYIGVTKDLTKRIKTHFRGRGSILLKNTIHKHGIYNFQYKALIIGTEEYIYDLELKIIELYKTRVPRGYNITEGGVAPPNQTGIPKTLETRAKMSAWQKGIKHSPEHIANVVAANTGRKQSPEHIAKRTAGQIGRARSLEAIAKSAAFHTGRKRLPETCEKIRLSKVDKKQSQETKTKISVRLKGRKPTSGNKGMRWALNDRGRRIYTKSEVTG